MWPFKKKENKVKIKPIPPFCEDCKWFVLPETGQMAYSKCSNPIGFDKGLMLVTKEIKEPDFRYCDNMRGERGTCKLEGLYFEPKEGVQLTSERG